MLQGFGISAIMGHVIQSVPFWCHTAPAPKKKNIAPTCVGALIVIGDNFAFMRYLSEEFGGNFDNISVFMAYQHFACYCRESSTMFHQMTVPASEIYLNTALLGSWKTKQLIQLLLSVTVVSLFVLFKGLTQSVVVEVNDCF